jgi:transcriptional regulator with XRE-family HTH domain
MILIVRGHINASSAKYDTPGRWKTSEFASAKLCAQGARNSKYPKKSSRICAAWNRTYIGGIERGERNLGLVNIERIAKTFGISLSELFRGVWYESQQRPVLSC